MTLAPLVEALPPWTLVGGKGGVGKTTAASAVALFAARAGQRTLLVSTDPARTLAHAIRADIGAEPSPVPGAPGLFAAQVDAAAERASFLSRWRPALLAILDRGTYLAPDEIEGMIDAAFPGIDESMALLALAERATTGWDRVVLDTAPTGHTLRLLELPASLRALIDLLESMQEKHRFMVSALTHRYRVDDADRFLDAMRGQLDQLRTLLGDPARTRAILITRPEPVVAAETARYAAALAALHLRLAAVIVNTATGKEASEHRAELGSAVASDAAWWRVPRLTAPPIGLDAIAVWADSAVPLASKRTARRAPARRRSGRAAAREDRGMRTEGSPVPVRALTIVGGKGGVGKTTAACALAIAEADAGRRVLVVSTDPAPSVADALQLEVGDEEVAVPGVRGLGARQMDATAAFQSLRAEYERRIDALFDAVLTGGVDMAHDRRIARELLALAPPGIDELYAVASLGELLEAGYERVIVDPAPTGHLLRLLEMPAVALDWSHRLMRLMLRYKEVGGLGDTAGMLLAFAKRTRALGELLGDASRAGAVVIALDEPLVRGETSRLVAAIREHRVEVLAIVWNRAESAPEPLPLSPAAPQFVADALTPPPRGVVALRRWADSVRALAS